ELECRDPFGQSRGNLNRGRARADHPDAAPVQRRAVIPARAVETRAGEALATFEVGDVRMMQHARRGDDDVGIVPGPFPRLQVPAAALEFALRDLFAEADAGRHAVPV